MEIEFTFEKADIKQAQRVLADSMGQLNWITAQSMTKAAKAAKAAIAADILPKIEGGATRWTKGGLHSTMARPGDLKVQAGFPFGTGRFDDSYTTPGAGVTPTGRYMTRQVAGGSRASKSTERQLIRGQYMRENDRLIPEKSLRDGHGNTPGSTYKKIKNAILKTPPNARITPSMTTKQRKAILKQRSNMFILRMEGHKVLSSRQPGGRPVLIAKRVGKDMRGLQALMFIEPTPSYRRRFNVDEVALPTFMKEFKKQFEIGLAKEIERRKGRRR